MRDRCESCEKTIIGPVYVTADDCTLCSRCWRDFVGTPGSADDKIDRAQLLVEIRKRIDVCHSNADNDTRPPAYRLLFAHFAEAGEQIYGLIEGFGSASPETPEAATDEP